MKILISLECLKHINVKNQYSLDRAEMRWAATIAWRHIRNVVVRGESHANGLKGALYYTYVKNQIK